PIFNRNTQRLKRQRVAEQFLPVAQADKLDISGIGQCEVGEGKGEGGDDGCSREYGESDNPGRKENPSPPALLLHKRRLLPQQKRSSFRIGISLNLISG